MYVLIDVDGEDEFTVYLAPIGKVHAKPENQDQQRYLPQNPFFGI